MKNARCRQRHLLALSPSAPRRGKGPCRLRTCIDPVTCPCALPPPALGPTAISPRRAVSSRCGRHRPCLDSACGAALPAASGGLLRGRSLGSVPTAANLPLRLRSPRRRDLRPCLHADRLPAGVGLACTRPQPVRPQGRRPAAGRCPGKRSGRCPEKGSGRCPGTRSHLERRRGPVSRSPRIGRARPGPRCWRVVPRCG